VPSKIKHNIVRAETTSVEEHDNGFLQFGIYDQISKSPNIFNSSITSPCQAAASVMPDRPKSTFVLALLFCPINILWNFPGVCRPPLPSRLPPPGGAPAYGVSSSSAPLLLVPSRQPPTSPGGEEGGGAGIRMVGSAAQACEIF